MRILIATPEAAPYVKTGGLADVAGSLLRELRGRGIEASLILPLYREIREHFRLFEAGKTITLAMGDAALGGSIRTSDESSCPEAYFIECDGLFDRPELYGTPAGDYPDNAVRFAFFARGILETCIAMGLAPDVIHCNDWQTGLLPLYLKAFYRKSPLLRSTAVLFTIHNMGYQGIFPKSDLAQTGIGADFFHPDGVEFYGKINYMKAGLEYADLLSTVSETYAREILEKENGFGLEGVLRQRRDDICGILNGVDYTVWDPSGDTSLPAAYSAENRKGKAVCKKLLLKATGLNGTDRPLFGMVNRFSSQKGIDLFAAALDGLLAMDIRIVVLGKGDEYYQDMLREAVERSCGRVFLRTGFDETFAHLVYAGCDFLLMPSRYEPCGLGQLIAMRYGAIPVARHTGGLADTIRDYARSPSKATGFLFFEYTPEALTEAVGTALEVYGDARKFGRIVSNAMREDFSWSLSAGRYIALYEKAVTRMRS
ncbi:MAG: glycogen synthase GlgA [Nitrospiraceae bacterium]|nr:glycogen synthase GlgA [Nitrospiraceae bacterium]